MLKTKAVHLQARGKSKKVVFVAVMQKTFSAGLWRIKVRETVR